MDRVSVLVIDKLSRYQYSSEQEENWTLLSNSKKH